MRFDSDQDYMDYLAEPEEEMDAEWESLLNHQPATEPMSLDDWEDREFSEAW
jgi:hypothetical protein